MILSLPVKEREGSFVKISASIMCGDQLYLKKELDKLQSAKVDLLHCDVMDGIFVNNLAMFPSQIQAIKEYSSIPLDIHLATIEPSKYIDMYSYIKPEYISFHIEASKSIDYDINKIRSYGIKPGIAVSPEISLDLVKPYISKVDLIVMMTVNPGFAGQKFNLSVLKKLDELKEYLSSFDEKPLIEVDGCINKNTIPLIKDKAVDVYVLGTSALFNDFGDNYNEKIDIIRNMILEGC